MTGSIPATTVDAQASAQQLNRAEQVRSGPGRLYHALGMFCSALAACRFNRAVKPA